MRYKIKSHPELFAMQKEIEDNFAEKSDLSDKAVKVKKVLKSEPSAADLGDGDNALYDDGTNQHLYIKSGGRLFKVTLTEV